MSAALVYVRATVSKILFVALRPSRVAVAAAGMGFGVDDGGTEDHGVRAAMSHAR